MADEPKPARMSAAARHAARHAEAQAAAADKAATDQAAAAEANKTPPPPITARVAPALPSPDRRLTPAKRHLARTVSALALAAAGVATPGVAPDRADTGPAASEYELIRAQLGNDMQQVSEIKSVEGKIALKAKLLPNYDAYVDGVLEAADATGRAVQDEVFVQLMIWEFDCGNWDRALAMAGHALKFGLSLPERFQRTLPTLVLEEVAEAALRAFKIGEPFDNQVLQAVEALCQDFDINDIVRAKLFKALGQGINRLIAAFDPDAGDNPPGGLKGLVTTGLGYFTRALALHDKAGVVKDIESLTRQAEKLQAATPAG